MYRTALAGAYLGMVPLMGLNLLQYSQQWQAADVFRFAPIIGPAAICHGARRAVLLFLTLPMLVLFAGVAMLIQHDSSQLLLLLPGVLLLPVYALIPSRLGGAVPLSVPTEEAKSAGRGLWFIVVMVISMALGGLALFAQHEGWFWRLVAGEVVVGTLIYVAMRQSLGRVKWDSAE